MLGNSTCIDLYTHFHECLSRAGGESYRVATLSEAAEIIVPPNFDQHHQWGTILPLLRRKGIILAA